MSIETRFDIPLIARMASREKQIQQHYRPVIAVHKWFARRPGTLFRGLILSEFCDKPLAESFFAANDCSGLTIADPFMGGGTPLLEANRVGCDVIGCDVELGVIRPQMFGDPFRVVCLVVVFIVRAYRKRLYRPTALGLHQCQDRGTVDATREKSTERHVGDHSLFHRVSQKTIERFGGGYVV